ncbi:unnamed protein product (macronuclear) [Paramecium tetraurelia]|uniref:Chromosome undetermined scaffold_1, whole genome shotgun sequence n=1 Tax=Paramecium tetraurelia TaxID=5888 RepID=Q6BFB8_PARTE|nr:hypothetical protein [Paramecium tetraurelia strain d4-2]XP_001422976.1 uncharacterized protein GSPATT00000013001 [Paramecium tetraurelia]CAH03653.1 hypothetical protein PTMB.452 [Paramecium tetraurelia]CAK55578.1 unnamed protein product [Paramecium tetraurelia]|eukprot:XP_001422976.1 hypothetical protein (macronuclear) [Paramecium tetraurelia strain d4-2]
MSEQDDMFDLECQHNWYSQEFDVEYPESEKQQLERIKDKCNMNLLKRQLVCLFGFPTIQVDSTQIFAYLNGIMEQNEIEQKRMIRVLISFIGEVTSMEDQETRLQTIRGRVEQFLTIKGIKIEWSNKEWEQEIESLFESRYCNPYYSKIPYTQFEYANFFALLESPMPMFLRSLRHPCFCQVFDAKSTEDFKQLCNITDLKNVRRIRKYIQSIIDKLEEFRNLLIVIESRDYFNVTEVIDSFNQLSGELDKIINIDLLLSDKYSSKQEERIRYHNDVDNQTEKNSISYLETKTSAKTFTTINQGSLDYRSKKQKKKQKQTEKCYFPSTFLNYIDSESNLSQENSQNPESKCEDQLFLQDKFGIDTDIHKQLAIPCQYIDDITRKIEIYEKQQLSLQLIGFPCPILDQNRLKQILSSYNSIQTNKQTLIEQVICSIWESLTIGQIECNAIDLVKKQAFLQFQSLNLSVDQHEFENVLCNRYKKQATLPYNKNFEIAPFSLEKLSKLVNRKFPDQYTINNCLTSITVFQSKSIQPLVSSFNRQEIKKIRFIRTYINDMYQSLESLVQFRNKLLKARQNKQLDQQLVQEFNKLELNHLNTIVNRKIPQQYDQNQYCIIIDEKDNFDEQCNQNHKINPNAIEIENDIFLDEDSIKQEEKKEQNTQKSQKEEQDINLKFEPLTGAEQANQEAIEQQDIKYQNFIQEDLISPVQRNYFHEYQSPNFFNSPCFDQGSPLGKQQMFFGYCEFDQQEIESPDRQILQFQTPHNSN